MFSSCLDILHHPTNTFNTITRPLFLSSYHQHFFHYLFRKSQIVSNTSAHILSSTYFLQTFKAYTTLKLPLIKSQVILLLQNLVVKTWPLFYLTDDWQYMAQMVILSFLKHILPLSAKKHSTNCPPPCLFLPNLLCWFLVILPISNHGVF